MVVAELSLTAGEKVLLDRRRRGINQEDMAQALGIPRRKLMAIERGRVEPSTTPILEELEPYEACLILRRRAGMTLTDMSEKIRMSRWWICRMERGTVNYQPLVKYWENESGAAEA